MIQNYIPKSMRLNTLSKVAEETTLPRSINLPPIGGQSFDINESEMSFIQKLHSDYLAEQQQQQQQHQEQQQQQQQQQHQEQQQQQQ